MTHTPTGLRFRFAPDPAAAGEWDGGCIDLDLLQQLAEYDDPEFATKMARLSRESGEAFFEKLEPKKTRPLAIRVNPWELAVLDDAAKKANIDRAAYLRARALAAAKKELKK